MDEPKWFTDEHVWLDPGPDGTLLVGITSQGDLAMNGIQSVTVEDGELVVESVKAATVLDLPVKGELESLSETWEDGKPVARYKPGWQVDESRTKDARAYWTDEI